MITMTAAGLLALQEPSTEIVHEVTIGAPVNKDISRLVTSLPAMRQSFKPESRSPEVSRASIICDNSDDDPSVFPFSEWDASSMLNGVDWHGAKVTIKMGPRLPNGSIETINVYKGLLHDVVVSDRAKAELRLSDPLTALRKDRISPPLIGTGFDRSTPADMVYSLLIQAGYASDLDTASFAAASIQEDLAGALFPDVPLTDATWWSVIQAALKHSNAGIRWTQDGLIEYFYFRPVADAAVFQLHAERNLLSLKVNRDSGAVVNSVQVEKDSGATVVTTLTDSDSIAALGTRQQTYTYDFTESFPSTQAAAEQMWYQSRPNRRLTVVADLSAMVLEYGDPVSVTYPALGLSAQKAVVFSRTIDKDRRQVTLELVNSFLDNADWIFTDNAQAYDAAPSKVFW